MCIDIGVLCDEVSHDRKCLVVLIGNTEEYLVIGILLSEGGLQILVEVRIKSLQRTYDGDSGNVPRSSRSQGGTRTKTVPLSTKGVDVSEKQRSRSKHTHAE